MALCVISKTHFLFLRLQTALQCPDLQAQLTLPLMKTRVLPAGMFQLVLRRAHTPGLYIGEHDVC